MYWYVGRRACAFPGYQVGYNNVSPPTTTVLVLCGTCWLRSRGGLFCSSDSKGGQVHGVFWLERYLTRNFELVNGHQMAANLSFFRTKSLKFCRKTIFYISSQNIWQDCQSFKIVTKIFRIRSRKVLPKLLKYLYRTTVLPDYIFTWVFKTFDRVASFSFLI